MTRGSVRRRAPQLQQAAAPWPSPVIVGGTLAALAAAVYVNALWNGLVWDDPIVLHRQLLAFRSWHDVVFTPRNIPQYSPDYYRPLTTLTYLLDRALGGSGPFMYHLSVILFHVITTWLVFRFGWLLFPPSTTRLVAAAIGAAVFAVHPIHTESVAWGAGRSDVLACLFALLAACAVLGSGWSALPRSIVGAGCLFLAVTAKETAAGLFLLLPVLPRLLAPTDAPAVRPSSSSGRRRPPMVDSARQPLRVFLPYAGVLLLYWMLRRAAIGTTLGTSVKSPAAALPDLVAAIAVYVAKLVLPVAQCAYISDLPSGVWPWVGSAAAVLGLGGLSIRTWQRGDRVVAILVAWMVLTLAPSLAILIKIPAAPIAERYLYIPSVGFCLLVGYAAAAWLVRCSRPVRLATLSAIGLVLAAAAGATLQRNAVWRSNLTLWTATAQINTTDGLPTRSLASAYYEAGDTRRAADLFQAALERRNDRTGLVVIHNNLGSIAMRGGNLDAAEASYRAALAIDPNAADSLFNLGLVALTRATTAPAGPGSAAARQHGMQARQLFERAAELHPLDPEIFVGLGQSCQLLGAHGDARQSFEHALALGLPPETEASIRSLMARTP